MLEEKETLAYREICYKCYRPQISCMCKYINTFDTNTKFIILMHPKEYRKTKNGSGHFTNLSLNNCELYVGIDFTNHKDINNLINDETKSCYVLYPGINSINLNEQSIKEQGKTNVLFLVDSTWACANSILSQSQNIKALPKMSFTHTKTSNFTIKKQPADYCLSTMETTLCVLELLNKHSIENTSQADLDSFLKPFEKMIEYQVQCASKSDTCNLRYKLPKSKLKPNKF